MSYSSTVLADSPLRYWRLGEASGTSAADSSGNNVAGTYVSGPTLGVTGLITGDADTAIEISSDTHVNCPIPASLSNCAIEVWWKFTTAGQSNIIWRDNTSAAGAGWLINLGGTNIVYRVSSTDYTTSTTSASVKDGGGHQFVVVATATTVELWIDGAQVHTASRSGSTAVNTQIIIGRNGTASGSTQYQKGVYDEVSVYSSLSGTRITAHYSAGIGGASISGTAAAALGGFTATATGIRTGFGTADAPLGGFAASVSGVRTTPGTASASFGGFDGQAASTPQVEGTATAALGGFTATAAGVRTALGTASAALGGFTASVTGIRTGFGAATAGLGGFTASATGDIIVVLASAGDAVTVWDISLDAPAVEYRALIEPPGMTAGDEAVDVGIRHSLVPYLPVGNRDPGTNESVVLQQEGDDWTIVDVKGKRPKMQPEFGVGPIGMLGQLDPTFNRTTSFLLDPSGNNYTVGDTSAMSYVSATDPANPDPGETGIRVEAGWYQVFALIDVAGTPANPIWVQITSPEGLGETGTAYLAPGIVGSETLTASTVYHFDAPGLIVVDVRNPGGETIAFGRVCVIKLG